VLPCSIFLILSWIKQYEILKLILTELQQNKTIFIIAEGDTWRVGEICTGEK
jgi:hypothetical protein